MRNHTSCSLEQASVLLNLYPASVLHRGPAFASKQDLLRTEISPFRMNVQSSMQVRKPMNGRKTKRRRNRAKYWYFLPSIGLTFFVLFVRRELSVVLFKWNVLLIPVRWGGAMASFSRENRQKLWRSCTPAFRYVSWKQRKMRKFK